MRDLRIYGEKYKKIVCKYGLGQIFCCAFLLFCALYILIKKDNIYFQIWDFLDSGVGQIQLIKDCDIFWDSNSTVPILGGISRDYFFSKMNIYLWLYAIFPTYYAIIIGWFLKIGFSILGMVNLGKMLNNEYSLKTKNIFVFVGLLYGISATHPLQAFGFSTLPLLLALLIKIYRTNNYKYSFILLFYPMFSDLFFFGVFICGYILLFFFIDWIKNKKPKTILLLSILFLTIGYIVVNYRLLNVLIFSNIKTIRNDGIHITYNNSIFELIKTIFNVFINGVDHAAVPSKTLILISMLYSLYLIYQAIKNKDLSLIFSNSFVFVIIWIAFNSVVYGLDSYGPFKLLISKCLPFLSEFSFARTAWFNPFLWCLSFAMILTKFNNKKLIYFMSIIIFASIALSNTRYNNLAANIRKEIHKATVKGMETTYKDYYSTDLFEQIKKDIDYQGEWSIAFGMHPSIIQYNGIHTIDGYISFYPLEYKVKFRKIIEPELLMDEEHREYYDNGGERAYIYSLETSYNTWKDEYKNQEANMYIDTNELKSLGGKYVFSRVKIINYESLGLELINMYTNDNSQYKIYLYKCQ